MSRTSGTLTLAPARSQVEAKRERGELDLYVALVVVARVSAGGRAQERGGPPAQTEPAGRLSVAGRPRMRLGPLKLGPAPPTGGRPRSFRSLATARKRQDGAD